MNRIIITGRLTKDIEIKTGGSGTEFCNFTVAVDRRGGKKGEKQTDFFECTAFGKTSAFLHTYFKKGNGIVIEGRMESRKYVDKDGNNRIAWGLTVDTVEFPIGGSGNTSGGSTSGKGLSPIEDESELPF